MSAKLPQKRIAWFVSPHGFGHAARSSAVMAAWQRSHPAVRFEIFTRVPAWFFQDSLEFPFGYHELLTDIGVAQTSPLEEDLALTVGQLEAFLPFDAGLVSGLAQHIHQLDCSLVVCDIAPLGIAVARAAGLPSALIENFTWDWIYAGYLAAEPRLGRWMDYLREAFAAADAHIQTEPVCAPGGADLLAGPARREPRLARGEVRSRLGVPPEARLVLVSMGGVPSDGAFARELPDREDVYFLVPGNGVSTVERRGRLVLLPHHSQFFHPDLVAASDAVVGKVGYSTLAETYYAGIPFGYITRERFRESPVLAAFVEGHMPGFEITADVLQNGNWAGSISRLLDLPRIQRQEPNGADQIAEYLWGRFF